ncbi:DNA-binding response regulator [Chitinophaga parva]|uniref:DNA-binding response regulator n=1 Tax=Chitinophaga parva TaxID=2169414 RepID=A0A2T7BP08_9BACT|nr:LytTR family DNA-binding domain-containing protein [Chitinophaga parva]PUZ29402.1 DNA-binding response regulator [Chitinophaga parva]
MKRLTCIIVDDEPVARKVLREFVDQVPFLELVGEFESAIKAKSFIDLNLTDLMFLDIEMPKLSGLEYLNTANGDLPLVIITTAYPKYAIDGYALDIIDYLLKPIAFKRFLKAVQKCKDYKDLKELATGHVPPSYLFIKGDKRLEKVELVDILYAESLGNYVKVVTPKKEIITYLTLKSIEEQLPSADFIKIHQSFVVNFSKIEFIEGNQVRIKNQSLPISRNFRQKLISRVEKQLLKR